ncbi:MAG: DUF2306 domain-containing protein [Cytophagaceae bacterium]|nr:DUF2306 domain-containing protein [Cytophagaceae bacterium]
MNKIGSIAFLGILLVFSWLMLKLTIPYFRFEYDVSFLLTKQSVLHIASWRYAFYIHISTSLIVLFTGIFQFVNYLLVHYPRLHRVFGKTYLVTVLFLSAPSGLIMSFYANGGLWSKISFVCVSLLWWLFSFIAYQKIKKRKIEQHINFMIRSYALTLSAISLRLYVVFLPHIFHLHSHEMYTLVAWLSWVPNLLIAEWIIRSQFFQRVEGNVSV